MINLTAHPDDATLLAHLAQELDGRQLEVLREHLVECSDCVGRLLDLEALQPEEPGEDVADFELAAAWREIRRQLPKEAGRSTLAADDERPGFFARVVVLRAAAAVLLVATGALAMRTLQLEQSSGELRRQLDTPQVNVPVLYLEEVRDAGSVQPIPTGRGLALLFLTPSDPRTFPRYAAELIDADGARIWSGSGLRLSEHGSLRLGVPRSLPPGRYVLKLAGLRDDLPVPLEEHLLEVQ